MKAFSSRWENWSEAAKISPKTLDHATDKTDKTTFVSNVSSLIRRFDEKTPFRCSRCEELEAEGVAVLICSTCGYQAAWSAPGPTATDLEYPLKAVDSLVPSFTAMELDFYEYWLDIYSSARWPEEAAQRGALRRALKAAACDKSRNPDKQPEETDQ